MTSSAVFLLMLAGAAQTRSAAPVPAVRQLASVEVHVTDRSGLPVKSAHVVVEGQSEREGLTTALGKVSFVAVKAGAYTLRVEREGFVPLEKEFTARPGGSVTVVAALSPAVAGAPAVARGPVGSPRVISIPDFVEKQLIGRELVQESSLGCSGAADARVMQVREPIMPHQHDQADEMLYVVAGEGTLKIGNALQQVSPGWFSMVPRGTAHSLTRNGRNPVILLSLLSGQPCPQPVVVAAAAR